MMLFNRIDLILMFVGVLFVVFVLLVFIFIYFIVVFFFLWFVLVIVIIISEKKVFIFVFGGLLVVGNCIFWVVLDINLEKSLLIVGVLFVIFFFVDILLK